MEITPLLYLIGKIILIMIVIPLAAVLSFIGLPVAIIFLALAYLSYWQNGTMFFDGRVLLILTILTFFAVFLDNIVLFLGLKKTEATTRGYIGAVLGSLAGIFTGSLIGLIVLTTLGAIGGELIEGKTFERSLKSGFGAAAGLILGSLLRAILSLSVSMYILVKLLF